MPNEKIKIRGASCKLTAFTELASSEKSTNFKRWYSVCLFKNHKEEVLKFVYS